MSVGYLWSPKPCEGDCTSLSSSDFLLSFFVLVFDFLWFFSCDLYASTTNYQLLFTWYQMSVLVMLCRVYIGIYILLEKSSFFVCKFLKWAVGHPDPICRALERPLEQGVCICSTSQQGWCTCKSPWSNWQTFDQITVHSLKESRESITPFAKMFTCHFVKCL